jgi:hypothetical protein
MMQNSTPFHSKELVEACEESKDSSPCLICEEALNVLEDVNRYFYDLTTAYPEGVLGNEKFLVVDIEEAIRRVYTCALF